MANETARALRKRMTPQEVKLWLRLRAMKSRGFHFRRQAPIVGYIVDFACFPSCLVIEVDGGQHGRGAIAASDRSRDGELEAAGFRVLRFWNTDVDQNLDGVVATIYSVPTANSPHPGGLRRRPSPPGGGRRAE